MWFPSPPHPQHGGKFSKKNWALISICSQKIKGIVGMKHIIEELQDHQAPQKFDHTIASQRQPCVVY